MLVRTGMHHFEVSRTAMYRVRYVLVRTSTYRLVLPCTRCTGFQMCGPSLCKCHGLADHGYPRQDTSLLHFLRAVSLIDTQ